MPTPSWQLSRLMTSGRHFIPEVDGLRFIAIASVVLFHLNGYVLVKHMAGATIGPIESWLSRMFSIGHYGVELFFVLSGFILATPFAKWRLGLGAKPALRKYFLRRLTRLEPPYIVLMILIFIGGLFALGLKDGLSHWPNLLVSLLYQHNFVFGQPSLVTVVAWSLEIEVQFYCLAPVLTAMFSIPNVLARRGSFLLIMIGLPFLRSFISPSVASHFNSLPWHLEFFIAGFLLADVFLLDWREAPIRSFAWDLLSLAAWPTLVILMLWGHLPILIAPVIFLAYVGAFKGKASRWALSRPLITTIGGMCYSMYLLHYTVISMTGRLLTRIHLGSSFVTRFGLDAVVEMPLILAITTVVFVFLERPCMDPMWLAKVSTRIQSK